MRPGCPHDAVSDDGASAERGVGTPWGSRRRQERPSHPPEKHTFASRRFKKEVRAATGLGRTSLAAGEGSLEGSLG